MLISVTDRKDNSQFKIINSIRVTQITTTKMFHSLAAFDGVYVVHPIVSHVLLSNMTQSEQVSNFEFAAQIVLRTVKSATDDKQLLLAQQQLICLYSYFKSTDAQLVRHENLSRLIYTLAGDINKELDCFWSHGIQLTHGTKETPPTDTQLDYGDVSKNLCMVVAIIKDETAGTQIKTSPAEILMYLSLNSYIYIFKVYWQIPNIEREEWWCQIFRMLWTLSLFAIMIGLLVFHFALQVLCMFIAFVYSVCGLMILFIPMCIDLTGFILYRVFGLDVYINACERSGDFIQHIWDIIGRFVYCRFVHCV